MRISNQLAVLDVTGYAVWSARSSDQNARPTTLAFAGDVYSGLGARTFTSAQWA